MPPCSTNKRCRQSIVCYRLRILVTVEGEKIYVSYTSIRRVQQSTTWFRNLLIEVLDNEFVRWFRNVRTNEWETPLPRYQRRQLPATSCQRIFNQSFILFFFLSLHFSFFSILLVLFFKLLPLYVCVATFRLVDRLENENRFIHAHEWYVTATSDREGNSRLMETNNKKVIGSFK